jgi:hypothetical protein
MPQSGRSQSSPGSEPVWSVGYLKASPSGRRLASACEGEGLVELFDFDPCTGIVSNPLQLDANPANSPYGITFSPDNGKLYVSAARGLVQYDLTRGERASIIASRTRITDPANRGLAEVGGAMQIGPDGKIYTVADGNWIGIIDHPDAPGQGCGYRTKGIRVTSAFGVYWLGLPNNIDAQRREGGDIAVTISPAGPVRLCQGGSVTLDAGPGYSSYRWSTGETTRLLVVKEGGRYTVTVKTAEGCGSATTSVLIAQPPRPRLDPEGTIYLCAGDHAALTAPEGYLSYRWSTGEKGRSITVGSSGSYSVTVVDGNGCAGSSPPTSVVVLDPATAPVITLDGKGLSSTPSVAYQWSRDGEQLAGDTARTLAHPVEGTYRVAIVDSNGCRALSAPYTIAPRPRHLVWIDTVSAVVGQRVRMGIRIDPPLTEADSVTGFRALLRFSPSALYIHGGGEGAVLDGSPRDGMIAIERHGLPIVGGRLGSIEVEGLISGAPLDPVAIDSVAVSPGVPTAVAGPGLVMLSGCAVGRGEAFGEGLKIAAMTPMPARDAAVLRYLAPVGALPTMTLSDAAGRRIDTRTLPPGNGDEQEARLDLGRVPSGVYLVELRDATGRSVLPIVISR